MHWFVILKIEEKITARSNNWLVVQEKNTN